MNKKTQHSTLLMASITFLISMSFCYVIAEYAIGLYQGRIANSSNLEPGIMRYHPYLGWTLSPSWQGAHQHHDFEVRYSTNAAKQRNGLTDEKTAPTSRVALVGDSFTFGFGVNDNETFHAQLNLLDSDRQYFNLGVPGYSTDQQYLMIKQLGPQNIDHTILMFYLANDLLDNALPYPLQASKAKPYFALENGQLKPHNQPVPRQAKPATLLNTTMNSIIFGDKLTNDLSLFEKLTQSSKLLRMLLPQPSPSNPQHIQAILKQRLAPQEELLTALLTAIKATTEQLNSQFTIALLPGQSYITAQDSYSAYYQDYVRKIVSQLGSELKIPVIDVALSLRKSYQSGDSWYHPNEGHLTAEGHKQVADILYKESPAINSQRSAQQ